MDTGYTRQGQGNTKRGEAVKDLGNGFYEVTSFTNPDESYRVHVPSRSCPCPAHTKGGQCVKHVVLADAFGKATRQRGEQDLPTLRKIRGEHVTDLCHRIFDRKRKESLREAYGLFLETAQTPYTTQAMVTAARLRLRHFSEAKLGKVA